MTVLEKLNVFKSRLDNCKFKPQFAFLRQEDLDEFVAAEPVELEAYHSKPAEVTYLLHKVVLIPVPWVASIGFAAIVPWKKPEIVE
jgi:hypothetical protein